MQRPKWLSGWGQGKNRLEACLLIDIPTIKVVEASFDNNLLFFAIGTIQKDVNSASGSSTGLNEAKLQTNIEWKIFYDPSLLPQSVQLDKAKNLIAGIVSATSGSTTVYGPYITYIVNDNRPSKGNAPLLLDYEIAKKIEEIKNRKSS